jgi:hypothetical protein
VTTRSDYYKILGAERGDDFAALKRAYYRRAKACHPDRHAGSPEKEEEFKLLVEAFDVLSDPARRREYDARLPELASSSTRPGDLPNELHFGFDEGAILDSHADDILEEMIVGNTLPRNATLQTLMLDLERTERFCRFREAKSLFFGGDAVRAHVLLRRCVAEVPHNILYRYCLARTCTVLGKWRRAEQEYSAALRLGNARQPPLRLDRVRRELEAVRRKHGGLVSKLKAALSPAPPPSPAEPEEEMRQQIQMSIDRLARRRLKKRKAPRRLTD